MPPNAVTMAWSWGVVRVERLLMALTVLMPVCKRFMVAPSLAEVARGP